MVSIDGNLGEGGGQILRTCLSLSLISGKPFRIFNIRSGRSKPGLQAQHLSAVLLSQKVGRARVDGAKLGSQTLTFYPHELQSGKFQSEIGTAGSTSLVLQTVYLPLSFSESPSRIRITGGTHVPFAPTFDWLNLHWKIFLENIGLNVELEFFGAGFYPQGGGEILAQINPVSKVNGLEISKRGTLNQIRGISAVANLDRKIAVRQRERVIHRLGSRFPLNDIRIRNLPSKFKGTSILLLCEFEHSQCCYTALGALGKPAEQVADEVCDKVEQFVDAGSSIDEYIADQLILPLSLAKSDSRFTTSIITDHLLTNVQVIKEFIQPNIEIRGNVGSPGEILIQPNP